MSTSDDLADLETAVAIEEDIHTTHASRRLQQRSIATDFLDLLFAYGATRSRTWRRRGRRGCARGESFSFTPATWRRFALEHPSAAKRFERYRNVYAVVAEGR